MYDASIEGFISKRNVYWFWCLFDVIYVAWYGISSAVRGNIPYLTDAASAIDTATNHGGIIVAGGVLFSFVFQLSIIASSVLLLLQHGKAKMLCYVQIPFRLLYVVPSVSIILIATSYFGEYNISIVLGLVVVSEILKGFTLWKFT
jgi:hypothetical protein